jgi:UDP-GlcNAc:undecaprenyl-phosphate GlcNAc-1-phosphate transferase
MNNLLTFENLIVTIVLLISSYFVSKMLVKLVIKLVNHYDILDQPDHRKTHASPTPSMGGIAIIVTIILFLSFLVFFMNKLEWSLITLSLISFSLLGFIDDWKNLSAKIKFAIQITFAVLGYFLDFKIDNAFGLFGIYEIPTIISFILTVGIYILLINAYNLIDGIDELAGGILAINFGVFSVLFYVLNQPSYLLISILGLGALLGFLKFNAHPAKVFMGDSGSLPLGMIMSLFTFKIMSLLGSPEASMGNQGWILPVVVAMNFIPFFDTLRVFSIRLLKGCSPFIGDRNHLHHLLLKNNLGHRNSALFIHSSHSTIVLVVVLLAPNLTLFENLCSIFFLALLAFEFNTIMRIKAHSKSQKRLEEQEKDFLKGNSLLNTLKK